MPRHRRTVMIVVLAAIVFVAASATAPHAAKAPAMPRPADDSVTVRRAIDLGNANYIAGWTKRDAAMFSECFAPDGAILTQTGRTIYGRPAIAERMTGVFQSLGMQEGRIATTHVYVLGDIAYETGRWWFTFVSDGKAAPDSGRFVEVWKRQQPGVWKMWRDIGVPKD